MSRIVLCDITVCCPCIFTAVCVVTSLQETYEQKRSEHLKDMHAREERMRQMFVQKVCMCTKAMCTLSSLFYLCVYDMDFSKI